MMCAVRDPMKDKTDQRIIRSKVDPGGTRTALQHEPTRAAEGGSQRSSQLQIGAHRTNTTVGRSRAKFNVNLAIF
eukprot:SAG31_NODE_1378_length_8588_cov_2.424382_5_plen_75_part_00